MKHVWRWTGFNHGLDLVVEYSNLNLTVKRNIPGGYRVTHLVANLGWVDFDLGCSTNLLGQ